MRAPAFLACAPPTSKISPARAITVPATSCRPCEDSTLNLAVGRCVQHRKDRRRNIRHSEAKLVPTAGKPTTTTASPRFRHSRENAQIFGAEYSIIGTMGESSSPRTWQPISFNRRRKNAALEQSCRILRTPSSPPTAPVITTMERTRQCIVRRGVPFRSQVTNRMRLMNVVAHRLGRGCTALHTLATSPPRPYLMLRRLSCAPRAPVSTLRSRQPTQMTS